MLLELILTKSVLLAPFQFNRAVAHHHLNFQLPSYSSCFLYMCFIYENTILDSVKSRLNVQIYCSN